MGKFLSAVLATTALIAPPALAEDWEISVYGGFQSAPHSGITGNDPTSGRVFDFTAGWEGRSFEMPPYYGIRARKWKNAEFGYGLEFVHAKVYADAATLANNALTTLEFTDGINFLTANVWRRWQNESSNWTPYVGAGLGLSIPYVEFQTTTGARTLEYQVTGGVVQAVAGVSYEINQRWSLFGEYMGTYSSNTASLNGGGEIKTNIVTNALNFGASYTF